MPRLLLFVKIQLDVAAERAKARSPNRGLIKFCVQHGGHGWLQVFPSFVAEEKSFGSKRVRVL